MFPDNRLVKEQMETGKSQETLDSVGLQSSVKEADDLESRTGEGTIAFWTFSSLLSLPCCLSGFGCLSYAPAQFSDHELVSDNCLRWNNVLSHFHACPSFCAHHW